MFLTQTGYTVLFANRMACKAMLALVLDMGRQCNYVSQETGEGCLPRDTKALQRSHAAELERDLQYDIIQISTSHLPCIGPLIIYSSRMALISST